ncbi:MAG: helix-turn-helix domain-containing protein [Coxiellaceae bacterium]|nr:MAG: helix-turn-helix domain-containing protein [Coxiellaceae bacterium]
MNQIDNQSHSQPFIQAPPGPGKRLRMAREAKKLNIEQVAEKLHLSKRQVAAIENDDYGYISVVYARGHVNLYAKFVGLPQNEIVRAFDLFVANMAPAVAITDVPAAEAVIEPAAERSVEIQPLYRRPPSKLWRWLAYVAGVVALLLLILAWYHHVNKARTAVVESVAQPIPVENAPADTAVNFIPKPVRPQGTEAVNLPLPGTQPPAPGVKPAEATNTPSHATAAAKTASGSKASQR